ncbi:Protein of unknown function DUF1376 [uncultured Caudovirales phage]|uniref:DUF1376 domain-containing protein n=1 Tax=uncultured Caudovirales phage TaxID=2100421 RepID=A0A6J5RUJ6_9CAUD|nr:Protein of unknown function DUF1376 [uncultured Caudovirales phage]
MFSYQFHIRDYLTKTRHLSPIEDLAYRRLLDTYYTEEQPLPSSPEQCARLIAMREYASEVGAVLSEFFTPTETGWTNERCDYELVKYHSKADSARKANTKRWGSKTDLKTDLKSDADQIPTREPKNPRTKKPTPLASEVGGFDTFWAAYPKKVAKPEAKKAWTNLKPDQELIARILTALTETKRTPDWTREQGRFVPHPSTWINQQRWEDELSTAESGSFDWEKELKGAL